MNPQSSDPKSDGLIRFAYASGASDRDRTGVSALVTQRTGRCATEAKDRERIELSTTELKVLRSTTELPIQIAYGGNRTPDIQITNLAFFHLNYVGIRAPGEARTRFSVLEARYITTYASGAFEGRVRFELTSGFLRRVNSPLPSTTRLPTHLTRPGLEPGLSKLKVWWLANSPTGPSEGNDTFWGYVGKLRERRNPQRSRPRI